MMSMISLRTWSLALLMVSSYVVHVVDGLVVDGLVDVVVLLMMASPSSPLSASLRWLPSKRQWCRRAGGPRCRPQ